MAKIKKVFLLGIMLLFTVLLCLSFNVKNTKAETTQNYDAVYGGDEVSTRGLYTKLTFALDGGNGQVWFSVKNKFTLFPATVYVFIELYNSDTYQDSYTNMTLVASNSIADLDQGETITATYSTNGKQSYWKARAYYKIDNGDWEEKITDTLLFNQYGLIIL